MLADAAGPDNYHNVLETFFQTQTTWAVAEKPRDALLVVAKQLGFTDETLRRGADESGALQRHGGDARPRRSRPSTSRERRPSISTASSSPATRRLSSWRRRSTRWSRPTSSRPLRPRPTPRREPNAMAPSPARWPRRRCAAPTHAGDTAAPAQLVKRHSPVFPGASRLPGMLRFRYGRLWSLWIARGSTSAAAWLFERTRAVRRSVCISTR